MAAAWLKPGVRLSVANKPVMATREVTLRTCFYLVEASAAVLSSSELTGPHEGEQHGIVSFISSHLVSSRLLSFSPQYAYIYTQYMR